MGMLRNWRRGWGLLTLNRPVRGMGRFSAGVRLGLRCCALLRLVTDTTSRLLLWVTVLLILISRSFNWHFDLQGPVQYLVLVAPFILLAPYFALAQFRQLGIIISARVHSSPGVRTTSQTATGPRDQSCAPSSSCHKSGAEK